MTFQFTTSHGGRLQDLNLFQAPESLSIHDLTRRSTITIFPRYDLCNLSIHDLTRRSTIIFLSLGHLKLFQFTTSHGGRQYTADDEEPECPFNSRPHTEVDVVQRMMRELRSSFNSRPHTEVDKRKRFSKEHIDLSIHDLTRRSTKPLPVGYVVSIFQFTTSHGGRRS